MSVYDVAAVDRLNNLQTTTNNHSRMATASTPYTTRRKSPYHTSLPASPKKERKADTLRRSMARHQASLSRPESPKNLYNEDTRSLYDEDTRSLHNEDTRSLNEETRSLYNDDMPRMRYKQRLQQPAYARQTSLTTEERKGNAGSRNVKSGYRTVSSTKTHSSTKEIDTGQAFQETKSNLRNSQIFLEDINYNREPNVDTRNYALRDDLPEINTQQYPSISGNSTYSLPRNTRLCNSDRRFVESRRDREESLRESQEDLYTSSQKEPYHESRETLLRRYPSSSLSRDYIPMAATQSIRQPPIESYHDGSTIYINSHPESYSRGRNTNTPPNSYLISEPSHRQNYSSDPEGSMRRMVHPDNSDLNSSTRSSRRSSPDRQSTPSHHYQQHPSYQRGYSANPRMNGVPSPTNSSRRSSRGVSPTHSTHSSRPVSPASSTRSYRGGNRPIDLPINPVSDVRCQSCSSHASSTRSSRATSPISNQSEWRVESFNNVPGNDSQNINSHIQQFLISSGQEAHGAPAVIYVRETFKIVNQGDQSQNNQNLEQGHSGAFRCISPKASTPTSVRESSVGSGQSSNTLTEAGAKQYSTFVKDIQNEANPSDPFKTFTGITRSRLRSSTPVLSDQLNNQNSDNKSETSLEGNLRNGSEVRENGDLSMNNSRDMMKREHDCINLVTAHVDQMTETIQNYSKSDVKSSTYSEESSKQIIEEANSTCDENNLEGEDNYQFMQQKGDIDDTLDDILYSGRKRMDKGINVNVHESMKHLVEEDSRSIGTQDSFTSITLDKSSLDLATSNLTTTERSSLEKLLDSLSRRVREIEGEREIVDQRVADLADVDDSARAESVTSLVSSASSKGRQERRHQEQNNIREGDVEVHSTIRRQSVIIEGLSLETEELRRKCQHLEGELGTHGTTTPVVEDLSNKLELVEGKLEESESYCYQVIEENVELKSEMENLEAEISEVQDSFRDKDAKEFKKVKWELENLSKTCRNLQIKLGKAQAKASRLRHEKEEVEDRSKEQAFWKTTAVVAAAALATYSVLSRLK